MRTIIVFFSVLVSVITQDVPNMRHVHPSLVTSCVTEQLRSGLDNVKSCLKCFEAVGDPLSQEGLDKAKICTDTWLPRAHHECKEELDAMAPGDIEKSEIVLACFTDVRSGGSEKEPNIFNFYSLQVVKCFGKGWLKYIDSTLYYYILKLEHAQGIS